MLYSTVLSVASTPRLVELIKHLNAKQIRLPFAHLRFTAKPLSTLADWTLSASTNPTGVNRFSFSRSVRPAKYHSALGLS